MDRSIWANMEKIKLFILLLFRKRVFFLSSILQSDFTLVHFCGNISFSYLIHFAAVEGDA